jgi:hypothetical protein
MKKRLIDEAMFEDAFYYTQPVAKMKFPSSINFSYFLCFNHARVFAQFSHSSLADALHSYREQIEKC